MTAEISPRGDGRNLAGGQRQKSLRGVMGGTLLADTSGNISGGGREESCKRILVEISPGGVTGGILRTVAEISRPVDNSRNLSGGDKSYKIPPCCEVGTRNSGSKGRNCLRRRGLWAPTEVPGPE